MTIPVAKITMWDGSVYYTDKVGKVPLSQIVTEAKRRFLSSGRKYIRQYEVVHLNMPMVGYEMLVKTTPKSELFN